MARRCPGFAVRLGAVDEAVAARPDLVVRWREIGHDETAPVVGHHALDVADRKVAGFRNHPDAGLRTLGSGHDAADVVVVDRDVARRLLCGWGPERQERREGDKGHETRDERERQVLDHDALRGIQIRVRRTRSLPLRRCSRCPCSVRLADTDRADAYASPFPR